MKLPAVCSKDSPSAGSERLGPTRKHMPAKVAMNTLVGCPVDVLSSYDCLLAIDLFRVEVMKAAMRIDGPRSKDEAVGVLRYTGVL